EDVVTRDRDGDGDVDSDDEDLDFDENGFNHPSTYTNQPWIWLPKDEVGVSARLAQEFRDAGVEASDVGAFMDMKGIVEVQRNPPDEDWAGGHD
ncbi:phosphate metabolism protein-domain-containing protein, partial [Cristinia sonorae]